MGSNESRDSPESGAASIPEAAHLPVPADPTGGADMLRQLVEGIDARLPNLEAPGADDGSTALATELRSSAATPPEAASEEAGALHVLFELAGSSFALPAASLAEVKVFEPPVPIPGVPPWVLGIVGLRGETLSVIDLSAFLGFSQLTRTELARLMIVFDPRQPKRILTGFAVDAVSTHEWLPETGGRAGATAALSGRLGAFTDRILDIKGQALAVLDLEALLTSEEFLHLSH